MSVFVFFFLSFFFFFFFKAEQFTIVPTISLTLNGFLDIKAAFYLTVLAHYLVMLNVNASLFSCPSRFVNISLLSLFSEVVMPAPLF